jgi:hypothetical protein
MEKNHINKSEVKRKISQGHTMTILFHKTGTQIHSRSFLGDNYRSEYVFSTLNQLPIATLEHVDFRAIIKFNNTVFRIEPDHGSWIYKYIIYEGDSVIGQMKIGAFNSASITLSTGEIFKLTRQYRSIWERFVSGFVNKVYRIQLQSDDVRLFYEFKKEVKFKKGYSNERYRELRGKIDSDIDNLVVSFFGIVLIERLLENEGS